MVEMISRRSLLAGLAAVPAAAVLEARPAEAWSVEEADVGTQALFDAGRSCGNADPRHPQLLADLKARLAEAGLSAAEQDEAIRLFSCPFCGCPVSG
jgi:hypothetical protein